MNHEFKKIINTAKNIELSEIKKASIRARIEEFIALTPIRQAQPSPLRSPFYFSRFTMLHMTKVLSLVLIVLVTGGSTMTLASEKTLPGDVFYTVKVNIKEPIEAKLARTPEAKLEFKTKQVEKRLTEAQILLQKNDTTPSKHKEVEDRVEQKISEISETIETLQAEGDVATILATTGKLEPMLQAHKEALENVVETEELETNKEEEIQIFSIDTQKISEEIKTPEEVATENPSKESIADTLLKTVERNLITVEAQETRALETLNSMENTSEESSIDIEKEALKKIDELTKKIQEVKEETKLSRVVNTSKETNLIEGYDLDLLIDQEIQTINATLRSDTKSLLILEATLFLEKAHSEYQQKLFTEALTTAQNGIKIIEGFDATTNIETITSPVGVEPTSPSTQPILIEAGVETATKTIEKSNIIE